MQLGNVLLLPQIPLRCLSMELFFLITAQALSFTKLSFQTGVFDIFVAGSMHQRPVSVRKMKKYNSAVEADAAVSKKKN